MSKVSTILYASDLGEGSRPAFRVAIEQAKAHRARVVYLHVVAPLGDMAEEAISDFLPESANKSHLQRLFEERKSVIKNRLNRFHDDELTEDDVELVERPEVEVVQGKAYRCILDAAQKFDADLIVMGDRASSSLSRIFLGSTAQKVIHQSVRPVLIVPLFASA
ncbi:MAG: universal stress protein [Neptuniibacter sp.]